MKKKLQIALNIISVIVTCLALCALILVLVRNNFYQAVMVSGSSMAPTLHDEDYGYALKVDEKSALKKIERFDIITFDQTILDQDKRLIKRVIGLPGETIYFDKDSNLYVNDILIEQDFIDESVKQTTIINSYYTPGNKITIDDDSFFVLGDNRNNSTDSLHGLGQIKADQILGILKAIIGSCTGQGDTADKVCDSKEFKGIKLY